MPWCVFRAALVEAAMEEMSEAHADCCLEVQRMLQLHNDYLANADAPDICYLCREEGTLNRTGLKNRIDCNAQRVINTHIACRSQIMTE